MKHNILKYSLLILIAFAGISCEKSLEELNENPNAPEYANPDYLFTNTLIQGAGSYNVSVHVEQWGLMTWTQSLARYGGWEQGKEYEMSDEKNNLWGEVYANSLMNAQAIVDILKDDPEAANQLAICKIWQAYLFQRLTDLWGDIPYSEALKGYDDHLLTPKYDAQSSIYPALIDRIDKAIAGMNPDLKSFGSSADLLFGGDIDLWKRFGNSLKLRMALRMCEIAPDQAQEIVSEISPDQLMQSNEQSALFPFLDTRQNPFYAVIQRGESAGRNWPSKYLTDMLNGNDDPRLQVLCQPTPQSVAFGMPAYEGVPCFAPDNSPVWDNYPEDGYNISKSGTYFMRSDMKGYLMSYAEICFLKAEAAQRGWMNGNATEFLKEGVRADMESYKIGDSSYVKEADIQNYLDKIDDADLETIITQKWIAYTFKNPYECYADYRRTGFPVLTIYNGEQVDAAKFPKRLIYPASELTYNTDNYNEAVQRQGADTQSTRIWWNK